MTRSMARRFNPDHDSGVGGQRSTESEAYTPGLGEIMSLQQMRHAKLYFAGQAENWDLAAYELDEIGEGFDDVLSTTRRIRSRRLRQKTPFRASSPSRSGR